MSKVSFPSQTQISTSILLLPSPSFAATRTLPPATPPSPATTSSSRCRPFVGRSPWRRESKLSLDPSLFPLCFLDQMGERFGLTCSLF
ncbi:uncharacterized protein G2W53_033465 [Senna tora]|uniref:Uncharacterized protein n=1 Tax=Senna tora TaxID=362788 RepID=A0A834T9M2_9FABA|nr:uncharacterized protein G2W53_033465 [Senna tora]